MKKTGQQTRFRDDLRRLLLFYSLLPVLSAVLLLIVFLGYIPLQNVVHGTADNLQLAWDAFGQEWQSLQNELLSLQSQLDLDAFRSSVNYQAAVKSRIYQFINQGVSRPQFFLLDADENLVFSSQTNEAMRESLQKQLSLAAGQQPARLGRKSGHGGGACGGRREHRFQHAGRLLPV